MSFRDDADRDRTEMVLTFTGLEVSESETSLAKPIDILAWSIGASYGLEGDKAKPASYFQNLSLTKYITETSPLFFKALANNRIFKSVILECTNKNQNIKLILKDAFLTGVSTGGSGGETNLTENISLGYSNIETIFEDRNKESRKAVTSGLLESSEPLGSAVRRY